MSPGVCRNVGYLYKTQNSKTQSGEISFVYDIHFSRQIVLKIRTEHGIDTAVLCAKFQNDLTTDQ